MANKKENGYSIGNLIKTGTFCAMAGAIGGGLYTYDKEEEESHRHFRSLELNYRNALNGFQPTRDSLHNKIFTYTFFWTYFFQCTVIYYMHLNFKSQLIILIFLKK